MNSVAGVSASCPTSALSVICGSILAVGDADIGRGLMQLRCRRRDIRPLRDDAPRAG